MSKPCTRKHIWLCLILALSAWACTPDEPATNYDLIVRGGTVYDGLGSAPVEADVAVNGDRIAAVGDLSDATGTVEIDATAKAVSPGFINMLSWATESMIEDGRAMSDIMQPLNDDMKKSMADRQGDIRYDIEWTTLGEYLEYLEAKGVSPNIASYVGATTVRIHEIAYEDRAATGDELERMRELVREAMRDGAVGVGSSLIYAPANFADTDELIALVSAAAEYGGAYVSHIRSEGARLEEAVQELIDISRASGAPAEIYHLKAAGKANWDKLESVFEMVEDARREGLAVTANMYTYPVAATGLDAAMPLWGSGNSSACPDGDDHTGRRLGKLFPGSRPGEHVANGIQE